MMRTCTRCLPALAVLMTVCGAPCLAQPARQVVVMPRTLEAGLGQPKVRVQLRDGDQIVTGEPMLQALGLGDVLPDEGPTESFSAYLDTGASAVVLSDATAKRFDLQVEPEAIYHEAGLHGETPMKVSVPYDLSLIGAADAQRVRLQINPKPPQGLMALMGEINVVGMPVIRHYIVEIDPMDAGNKEQAKMMEELNDELDLGVDLSMLAMAQTVLGGGATVRLHPPEPNVEGYDYAILLRMVDYSRYKNPADRGPMPAVAPNPMVMNVRTETAHDKFTGAWLLDTGAAASIISTRHAQALGLLDENGRPTRPRDFTLPIGGIGGQVSNPPGFIIDRMTIPAHGVDLEFRDVRVLVHDVGTELDNGSHVILDGVLGMNLLLPSVSGMASGFPSDATDPPFRRIWIDGPRSHLLLEAQPPVQP